MPSNQACNVLINPLAEHHVLYQYNLVGAKDHWIGFAQTEAVRTVRIGTLLLFDSTDSRIINLRLPRLPLSVSAVPILIRCSSATVQWRGL
jgi:hypothetical protein